METRLASLRRLCADRDASVAVEFAFIATILLTLASAGADLISISGFNREIERSTTQVARMIATCPAAAAGASDCVTATISLYRTRAINALVRYPSMNINIVQVNEINGALSYCGGNGTYLESDVASSTLAVLSNKDSAIVVVMSMTYKPIFPIFLKIFTGSTTAALRGYTIAVRASNSIVCQNS